MGLGFQAPARANPVEVPINVELKKIGRVIAGAPRRLGLHADEPGRTKLEPVDERLDELDRIIRPDIIIHRFGQQQELRAVRSNQMRHG